MKKTIIFFLVLFTCTTLKSQVIKIGITANTGVNNTFIVTNDGRKSVYFKYDKYNKYYKPYYAINLGIYGELSLFNKVNLGTEVLFFQKTSDCKIGDVMQMPELNSIVKYNYISVPLYISYNFTKIFELKTGYYNNLALSYQPKGIFNDYSYTKRTYSISFLLGLNFNITKNIQLNITGIQDIRPSLIDKINPDKTEIYNQSLTLGVRYKLF